MPKMSCEDLAAVPDADLERKLFGNLKGLEDNLKAVKKAAGWMANAPEPMIYAFAARNRVEDLLREYARRMKERGAVAAAPPPLRGPVDPPAEDLRAENARLKAELEAARKPKLKKIE